MSSGPNTSNGSAHIPSSSASPSTTGNLPVGSLETQSNPLNIVVTPSIDPSPFGPSSPLSAHTRSHPFFRKMTTRQSISSGSPNGSSAFSTSANNANSGKTVDDAIAAAVAASTPSGKNANDTVATAAAPVLTDKSPAHVAADATDALFIRRLSNMNVNEEFKSNREHHEDCSCGYHSDSEDEVSSLDTPRFEPISDEAREFTEKLLGQNKDWAKKTEQERPGFFAKLEKQQKPQILWIGCSDSRVPANQIVNLDPGEIFVHRNIANVVTHTDMNLLSVLEYAVDVLKVRHIIICGHYGCGGVAASLTQKEFGVIDNWLRNIKDLYTIHRKKFDVLPHGGKEQQDLLTELNVIQSALNVCHTSIIQRAWSRGAKLSVHGWCYRLSDGVIRNLGLCVEGPGNVEDVYQVTKS
ncbi:hypothetical protein BGZ76_010574 [Entomortierella beljakovae]|nr:hypothetical protein BGZ76_010574 [Entomortierella beljakovae]